MADKIATEQEAKDIGGNSSFVPIDKKCCTFNRASQAGCIAVDVTFVEGMKLAPKKNLMPNTGWKVIGELKQAEYGSIANTGKVYWYNNQTIENKVSTFYAVSENYPNNLRLGHGSVITKIEAQFLLNYNDYFPRIEIENFDYMREVYFLEAGVSTIVAWDNVNYTVKSNVTIKLSWV